MHILRLPKIIDSTAFIFILFFCTFSVLASDKQSLPGSEVLQLIGKTQVAGSSQTFTGTALFETSGAARRMSNISQAVCGKLNEK